MKVTKIMTQKMRHCLTLKKVWFGPKKQHWQPGYSFSYWDYKRNIIFQIQQWPHFRISSCFCSNSEYLQQLYQVHGVNFSRFAFPAAKVLQNQRGIYAVCGLSQVFNVNIVGRLVWASCVLAFPVKRPSWKLLGCWMVSKSSVHSKCVALRDLQRSLQRLLSNEQFSKLCEHWRSRNSCEDRLEDVYDGQLWNTRMVDRVWLPHTHMHWCSMSTGIPQLSITRIRQSELFI